MMGSNPFEGMYDRRGRACGKRRPRLPLLQHLPRRIPLWRPVCADGVADMVRMPWSLRGESWPLRSVPTNRRGIALTARRGWSEDITQLYPTYRTPVAKSPDLGAAGGGHSDCGRRPGRLV